MGDCPWCDHCQKRGHTKDTCWNIHRKLPTGRNLRPNHNSKAYHGESKNLYNQITTSPFTKEQLEVFQHLFNPQTVSTSVLGSPNVDPSPSCFLAQSCITQYPFSALANSYKQWIIDFGATYHMTWSSTSFTAYVPCAGNMKVRIADGSHTLVVGKGTISLTKTFSLELFLHVPNLSYNLLSISKLTRDLNCVAKFSSTSVVFQDLASGRTIGSACECEGLYHFDECEVVQGQVVVVGSNVLFIYFYHEIMLWHYRLGQPSFLYLRFLFPKLSKN